MCPGNKDEWFQTWFDSPYYHALYHHRDSQEAAAFLSSLIGKLSLQPGAKLLDLACGKGRHSLFLNSHGFDVTGVDLSAQSIGYAAQFESPTLRFCVQDMRKFELKNRFDCILNLFTSFGYFDREDENIEVLKRVKEHLVPGGSFVLDYFNADIVCTTPGMENGGCTMEKNQCGFHFSINKHIASGRVFKEIQVTDGEKKFHFKEQVQLLNATMLHAMLKQAGLTPVVEFGDYTLQPFNPGTSERLIIIARN